MRPTRELTESTSIPELIRAFAPPVRHTRSPYIRTTVPPGYFDWETYVHSQKVSPLPRIVVFYTAHRLWNRLPDHVLIDGMPYFPPESIGKGLRRP